jgi:predicted ABC-type ATPase
VPKSAPSVVVIGGPNGAGKTTISRAVVAESSGLVEFVNADVIAQGLSGFDPQRVAFQAGRLMLVRLHALAAQRASFAFESTLASRTFAPWLRDLISTGYEFHLVYSWLRSPDLAVRRVRARVNRGGHAVPPEVVRRRYTTSIFNFFHLYRPLARAWRLYDNSGPTPIVVADGGTDAPDFVHDAKTWDRIVRLANEATQDE